MSSDKQLNEVIDTDKQTSNVKSHNLMDSKVKTVVEKNPANETAEPASTEDASKSTGNLKVLKHDVGKHKRSAENLPHKLPEKTVDTMNKSSSKKRRKDKLHPMHTPDIYFETITLDDDENKSIGPIKEKKKKKKKTKKSSNESKEKQSEEHDPVVMANKACDDFLNDVETENMLREIAEERVRINYLLASFGMPDINFSLGDTVSTLDNQLSERFRQRIRRRGTMN